MHPAIPVAALSLAASAALFGYVGLHRDKSDLHWRLLALLLALMVWTTGTLCRFSVASEAGLRASLHLIFLGVFATPPLWLALAARYARPRGLAERREVLVLVQIPSALAYLALLTNDAHHLVMREVGFAVLERGARAWAGPVFWAFLAWAYACVLGGVAVYLATARRLAARAERLRALVLALASVIPALFSTVYVFHWVPVRFDLTPASLVACLLLVSLAVFRYRLLESTPLAPRDVIEHLADGVLLADAGGAILEANPAAERILGRRAGRLERRALADVLAELVEGEEAEEVRARLAPIDRAASPLLEIRTADGRRIEARVALVHHAGGERAGQLAVLRDRTEERRGERVHRQTQKLQSVGTLAAGIAHEVNNPLAFIRANLSEIQRMGELVQAEAAGPHAKLAAELADLGEIAAETLDGIGRIEAIVSSIRKLAEAGRGEPFAETDVNEVVRDAIRLANLRRDPAVALELRLADPLPPVEASASRLAQALVNLLVNARQALDGIPGARIQVETRRVPAGVEIRVADNGPGIAESIQERIFDPFFTTKDPDQGTGLGLAISFDILRDHGGELEVASRPGAGACFTARLPLRRPAQP
jgi:PAS domain S-box-containing protein